MRQSLPIALLSLCLAANVAAAQTPSPSTAAKTAPVIIKEPRDIIDALYRLTIAELKKPTSKSPFFERKVREAYFSKGFDLLVTTMETKAAHDGDAGLDFDPITASQDAEIQKVALKTDVIELNKAVVSATFLNRKQPTVVSYDFIREDGDWKINDIKGTTEKEAWSVRKILTTSGKEPTTLPGMRDATTAPDASTPMPPKKGPTAR